MRRCGRCRSVGLDMIGIATMILVAALPPAPEVCHVVSGRDMRAIKVGIVQEEATEISATSARRPRGEDDLAHAFSVRLTRTTPGRGCLKVQWRTRAGGNSPATAADFPGGTWPHGSVTLAPWPTASALNPTEAEIVFSPRDEGIAEPNETFGFDLVDTGGSVIWGQERWAPEIAGGMLGWNNRAHANGVVMTIHDVGRSCLKPGVGSHFTIVDRMEDRAAQGAWKWPSVMVERPNRPIRQCEDIKWRLAATDVRSLRPADFRGGAFPSGTLRFSSDATEGPNQDDALIVPIALVSPRSVRGRRVLVVIAGPDGDIASKIVTVR